MAEEVRPEDEAVGEDTDQPKNIADVGIPERLFDGYSLLFLFRTIGDFIMLPIYFQNDFQPGAAVSGIGLTIAIFLRFVGNNLMGSELRRSGIESKPWSIKAIFNTIFGTRFGFQGTYERLKTEFAKDTVIEAIPADPGNPQEIPLIPPPPGIYGGTENLKTGPRTLQAVAEVVQQGLSSFPLIVLALEFGFAVDEDDVKSPDAVLIVGLISFMHLLCWLIGPSLNVSYGYVYFATWFSFTLPYLLVLLFSVALDQIVIDSYYTKKEIYAWIKTVSVLGFGITGLAVYNSNIHKMMTNDNYRMSDKPAILYFMSFFSFAALGFDLIAAAILLSDEKFFVFNDDQLLAEDNNIARLKAFVVVNVIYSAWTAIVARVETITVETELRRK